MRVEEGRVVAPGEGLLALVEVYGHGRRGRRGRVEAGREVGGQRAGPSGRRPSKRTKRRRRQGRALSSSRSSIEVAREWETHKAAEESGSARAVEERGERGASRTYVADALRELATVLLLDVLEVLLVLVGERLRIEEADDD